MIDRVIILLGFRTSRTTAETLQTIFLHKGIPGEYVASGLWALISLINHSCIANCERAFIGDMQIVRAANDIEAGSELFIKYHDTAFYESYDEVQKQF